MTWDGRYLWVLENQGDMLYKFDVGVPLWPRSQGFWKHQCSDNGFHQVSDAELDGLMSEVEARSNALSECSPGGCDLFTADVSNNDMRPKALKQLMAAWLNIASDRLYPGTEIDLTGLTDAATISDAIDEVETTICDPQASRSELTVAKNIAEALTSRDTDFDLGTNLSVVSVHAGEPGSVTIGLINR